MTEVVIKLPEDLKELESAPKIRWQLVVERRLKEELDELAALKRIIENSELTEEEAKELTEEVNRALAKRYKGLMKGE